ncbi:MAG: long-chain acyl-CoA synthetase [Limisphaerales bacterium]|jgi:long-chain acyl-CoA synthetase
MSTTKLNQLSPLTLRAKVTDGKTTWDHDALCAAISDWLSILDHHGASIVAFQLPNGLEWIALNLALLESNRVAVPLPHFFTKNQTAGIIKDCGADTVIYQSEVAANIESSRGCSITATQETSQVPLPEGTGIVTYTSGTTGSPKGVCLSWDTLLMTASAIQSELAEEELAKHLCLLPLSLLLENVAGLFANLLNGGQIICLDGEQVGISGSSTIDIPQLMASLAKYQPNSIILVPALLVAITAAVEMGLSPGKNLKFAAVGGATVPASLIKKARALGIPCYEGYGLTECGSVVSLNTPKNDEPGSAGHLLPHIRARIVDRELIIEHPVLLGYTGEKDIQDRPSYSTGDLIDLGIDDHLKILGRRKNAFITAFGRNVSPEWIESELTAQLAIGHALVFGEAETQNVALIVSREGFTPGAIDQAIERSNKNLPDYAQVSAWQRLSIEQVIGVEGITQNGRLRRQILEVAFQSEIEALHAKRSNGLPLLNGRPPSHQLNDYGTSI